MTMNDKKNNLKLNVEAKFDNIRKALNLREKLLLKQVDVMTMQLLDNQDIQLLTDNEDDLLNLIRSFGKFDIACKKSGDNLDEPEAIVFDFSRSKQRSKAAVPKSIENSDENEMEKEMKSDMQPLINTKYSQTEEKPRTMKPKITINNCNGTINLKNISNLIINCATEEAVHAEFPLTENKYEDDPNLEPKVPSTTSTSTSASSSVTSSNTLSYGEDKKQKAADIIIRNNNVTLPLQIEDEESATCEFYNRLLNEIKNSIKSKSKSLKLDKSQKHHESSTHTNDSFDNDRNSNYSNLHSQQVDGGAATTNHNKNKENKLVLRNFENLKIILESRDNDDSNLNPIQIEQWLAEIISETEIEPMQNTEILEHSKIHKELF